MNKNEPRKVTKEDGTVMRIWGGKLHNWEGPSIIHPDGKKEYYLHGIQLTEKDWKLRRKERESLPWYKKSGANARF
jgi:hypothetical protein